MAGRDNHIYVDYGELMECLLQKRIRFDSEVAFKNYAIAAVHRFLIDLEHIGIDLPIDEFHFMSQVSLENSSYKLGN